MTTEDKKLAYAEFIASITKAGEIHICALVNEDGSTTHSFLLPETRVDINWQDAMDWAKEQGGDLPNRVELVLLYENHQNQFEERLYWSNKQHASISSYAWFQHFGNGYQYNTNKIYELRARAVRRLIIQ